MMHLTIFTTQTLRPRSIGQSLSYPSAVMLDVSSQLKRAPPKASGAIAKIRKSQPILERDAGLLGFLGCLQPAPPL